MPVTAPCEVGATYTYPKPVLRMNTQFMDAALAVIPADGTPVRFEFDTPETACRFGKAIIHRRAAPDSPWDAVHYHSDGNAVITQRWQRPRRAA